MKKIITIVLRWLNRPFPCLETNISKAGFSFFVGLFVFLFLYLYKPFGISSINESVFLYTLGFGTISTLVVAIIHFFSPKIFKHHFDPNNWTILKNIEFFFLIVVLIAINNWVYQLIFFPSLEAPRDLFDFLLFTIFVGIFPIVFLTFILERQLHKKHRLEARRISETLQRGSITRVDEGQLEIFADNKVEGIRTSLKNLLYIASEGNYSKVVYAKDGSIKEQLLRLSLSNAERQIEAFDSVVRCHRSYIVNLDNVIRISGNARGYRLILRDFETPIPVSRSFPKKIIKMLKMEIT